MEELKSVAFIASILINYLRVFFFAEIDSLCIFLFAESQLNSFVQMKDAWKMCLYFITHTHNEYVMMYAMNVLEVKKKKGKKNSYDLILIQPSHYCVQFSDAFIV